MKKYFCAGLVIGVILSLCPAMSLAEGKSGADKEEFLPPYSKDSVDVPPVVNGWQVFFSLITVVALVLLLGWGYRRILSVNKGAGTESRYIRVLEKKFISPKLSLALVEVKGNVVLLGIHQNGVENLLKIEDASLSEEPLEGEEGSGGSRDSRRGGQDEFRQILGDQRETLQKQIKRLRKIRTVLPEDDEKNKK